jgi:hypothetical protein
MTQALGHDGITGYAPEKMTLYFTPDVEVTVIIVSDGFSEMILEEEIPTFHEFTADFLADLAERRWRQEWEIKGSNPKDLEQIVLQKFGGFDDILVLKMSNKE